MSNKYLTLGTALTYEEADVSPAIQAAIDLKQPLDTQLTDLAGLAYAGNSLKVVRVNVGETAFEVATPAAASVNIKETEVDFGDSSYVTEQTFTVTDVDVATSSQLIASLAIKSPSDGRDIDEILSEEFLLYCKPLAGSFELVMRSLCGSVNGKFLINYLVG